MQELGHDQVRDLIVHGRAEKDDPLVEQTTVDVERALPAGGLLDDHRYQWAHGSRSFSLPRPESFKPRASSLAGSRAPVVFRPLAASLAAASGRQSGVRTRPPPVPVRPERGSGRWPRGGSASGCPELAGALLGSLLPRRPQLLACLRLLDADRLGLAHEQVDRLARGEIIAGAIEPIGLAQLLEQLRRRGCVA